MIYSDELVDKICKLIEEGMSYKDSAAMEGVSESTFYEWKKEKQSFRSRVEGSLLIYKKKLISILNVGTFKKPELALEILRTKFPDEWNRVQKIGIVDPERELERIRKMVYGDDNTKNQSEGEVPKISSGDIQE